MTRSQPPMRSKASNSRCSGSVAAGAANRSASMPSGTYSDQRTGSAPGVAEPVRWSEYVPDGMLADLLAAPAATDPEHREFEALERIGGWERVIAWAQAH